MAWGKIGVYRRDQLETGIIIHGCHHLTLGSCCYPGSDQHKRKSPGLADGDWAKAEALFLFPIWKSKMCALGRHLGSQGCAVPHRLLSCNSNNNNQVNILGSSSNFSLLYYLEMEVEEGWGWRLPSMTNAVLQALKPYLVTWGIKISFWFNFFFQVDFCFLSSIPSPKDGFN